MTVDAFRALLANTDLFVYERSVEEREFCQISIRRGAICSSNSSR